MLKKVSSSSLLWLNSKKLSFSVSSTLWPPSCLSFLYLELFSKTFWVRTGFGSVSGSLQNVDESSS